MSEENAVTKTETENAAENGTAEGAKTATSTENAENNAAESAAAKENGDGGGSAEDGAAAAPAAEESAPEPPNESEELYKKLGEASEPKTSLKKYLTKGVLDKLKNKKTEKGGTLAMCIKSGEAFSRCSRHSLLVCIDYADDRYRLGLNLRAFCVGVCSSACFLLL
jgi:hypothetical protein